MWTIRELKERGKTAFKANYWPCVLSAFLLTLLVGGLTVSNKFSESDGESIVESFKQLPPEVMAAVAGLSVTVSIVALLLRIFLFNPLSVGCYGFFIENHEQPAKLDVLKKGFRNYGNVFITLFLRDLFLTLWTLLLIVPGLIKAYSYRMVPYILAEDPSLSPMECISRSKEMMRGHKWNAFVLDLSFIGWHILTILTFGIVGIFWTNPYKESTDAALYLSLR